MTFPTPFEQLTLELINQARLNPHGEYDRWVTNAPANVQNALTFFGVDLNLLQQQFNALTPTAPVAWSQTLGDAALAHTQLMLNFDQQSHQLPGEPSLGTRVTNAGYNFSTVGENVFAFAQDAAHGHAGFFIDWGSTPTGIQQPPGHRNNIMNPDFVEIGIGHLTDSNPGTNVGPNLVTHNLGGRFGYTAQITGVIFNDADSDRFYDIGEGLSGASISTTGANTTSFSSGGYNLGIGAGTHALNFGGPLGPATITVTLGVRNIKLDMYDPGAFRSSVSATLGANAIALELLGEEAIDGTGNALANVLMGNMADNMLVGGAANDVIMGGDGSDTVVFVGPRADYNLFFDSGFLMVADSIGGRDGTDSLKDVERLSFSDGLVQGPFDAPAAPTIISNGGGDGATVSVDENSTAVTTVTATDANTGTTLTYAIIGGADQTKFQINSSTGVLAFQTAPDFEAPQDADKNNSYIVQVQASDGALTDTQTLTVNITNITGVILSGPGNLMGTSESDTLTGTIADQTFNGGGANDAINGVGGHDSAVYNGPRSDYVITLGSGGVLTISDKSNGRDGTDTVVNVDYLDFSDKTIIVANIDVANIARLYSASLDRAPDKPGLNGWGDFYATGISDAAKAQGVYVALAQTPLAINGLSIAQGFTASAEFQSKYGTLNNTQYITLLYNNVLDRNPASAEVTAWNDLMTKGDVTGQVFSREMVLVGFAESPENIAKTAADWLIQI